MTDSPFVHASSSTTDNGIPRPAPRAVRPVLSVITRARFDATPRVDAVDVNEALHWLTSSTDPQVVFTHLAQLCTPMLCDVATVEMSSSAGGITPPPPAELAELTTTHPTAVAVRRRRIDASPRDATVTVYASSTDSLTGAADLGGDYSAALTCTWLGGYRPTPVDTALLKLLVRSAANVVLQARQAEQHQFDRELVAQARQHEADRRLEAASAAPLHRTIGAAIGVLMVSRQMTFQAAAGLIETMSRTHQISQAEVAANILTSRDLPPDRR